MKKMMKERVTMKPKRLERPKKQYPLHQCGLYGLKGMRQLLDRLQWEGSAQDLVDLAIDNQSYRQWVEDGRKIQAATNDLREVQARIATLLRRVLPPEYRHSGVRGRSFITNAAQHLSLDPSLKLDIKRFYPSTTFRHVYRFFQQEMSCAKDVANVLAAVCCIHKKHLPTGGVHSEVLAFFCQKKVFDSLAERASNRGGKATVYVDDIMITMPNASLTDLEWARKLFRSNGMQLHPGKSKVIRKRSDKTITGVRIQRGKMLAPQEQHQKIKARLEQMGEAKSDSDVAAAARSLLGHYDHVAQIDPRFKARAAGTRRRLMGNLK